MPFSVGVSGVWRSVPAMWVGVSGVWRPIQAVWVGVNGQWRLAYTRSSVTNVSVNAVSGTGGGGGAISTSTPASGFLTVSGSPAGGTYSWRRTGGHASVSATAPTSNTTRFTSSGLAADETRVSTWVCDYTLSGVTVTSQAFTVTIIRTGS